MNLSPSLNAVVTDLRAQVRVGYPWWLRHLLARDVIGITLGRRIYLSSAIDAKPNHYIERLLRHELAHVAQVNRLGLPRFLWRYLSEFAGHWWHVRSLAAAYAMISFEVEAAAAEESL